MEYDEEDDNSKSREVAPSLFIRSFSFVDKIFPHLLTDSTKDSACSTDLVDVRTRFLRLVDDRLFVSCVLLLLLVL